MLRRDVREATVGPDGMTLDLRQNSKIDTQESLLPSWPIRTLKGSVGTHHIICERPTDGSSVIKLDGTGCLYLRVADTDQVILEQMNRHRFKQVTIGYLHLTRWM